MVVKDTGEISVPFKKAGIVLQAFRIYIPPEIIQEEFFQ